MPLEFIEHAGIKYPSHEAEGNAARWIMPMALEYCKGSGLDIGYNRTEWQMPNTVGIDPQHDDKCDAMTLPNTTGFWDFIFSSHCLEHVKENWYNVLDYWLAKIKTGGIIFLYLPHLSQTYWHPSSNRKHIHSFNGDEIGEYLRNLGHKVFVGGCDANHSFVVICEKVLDEMVHIQSPLFVFEPQSQYQPKELTIPQSIVDEWHNWKEAKLPTGHHPVKEDLLNKYDSYKSPVESFKAEDKFAEAKSLLRYGKSFDVDLSTHEKVDDFLRSPVFQNLSLNAKRELLGFEPIAEIHYDRSEILSPDEIIDFIALNRERDARGNKPLTKSEYIAITRK